MSLDAVKRALGERREWRALLAPGGVDPRPDLRGIDLSGMRLHGESFDDVRLDGARFDQADLSGCSFRRTSLQRASFDRTMLIEVDAFAASLYAAVLDFAVCNRACFVACNMADTSLRATTLRDADLRGATLANARLLGAQLDGARIAGTDFEGAILAGTTGLLWRRSERTAASGWHELEPLVNLWGSLMHSVSPRARLVAEGCLRGSATSYARALTLLRDRNWRTALAGVAAYVVLGSNDDFADACWQGLQSGSWVAPQLAAALFLHDERFAERAAAMLRPLSVWALSWQRLWRKDAAVLPAKSAASLAALCTRIDSLEQLGRGVIERGGNDAQIAAKVTLSWLDRTRQAARGMADAFERRGGGGK